MATTAAEEEKLKKKRTHLLHHIRHYINRSFGELRRSLEKQFYETINLTTDAIMYTWLIFADNC